MKIKMNYYTVLVCFSAFFVLAVSEKETNNAKVNHWQEKHSQHHKKLAYKHREHAHHNQEYVYRAGSHGHYNHHLQGFRYRVGNLEDHCHWVCLPKSANSSTTGFQLLYNGTSSLIAALNKEANVAVLIDYSSNLVAFLNGASGEAVIINLNTKAVYRIKYSSENGNVLWLASKQSFETFFQNLSSLQKLYQAAESHGQKITTSNEIRYILTQFGVSSQEALSSIISFALRLHGNFGKLFHGSGSITIPQNLQWFLSVGNAFGNLLNSTKENLDNLGQLNLNKIFSSGSGLEALFNFLSQIGEHSNLAKIFEEYLSNPQKLFELLEQLGGESHSGLDGLITIIVNFIKELQGHGSLSKLFSSIINYNATGNEATTHFRTIVGSFLKLAKSQVQTYGNSTGLQNFIKILESLNNNNFIINHVNISEIINLLRTYNPAEAFSTITKIISRFLPTHNTIHQFFRFILNILNSTNSIDAIRKILPHGLDLSNFTNGAGSILQQITHGQNFTQILSSGSCQLSSILSRIRPIEYIINELAKVFGHNFFNESSIISDIQNVIGGGGHFRELTNILNPSEIISHVQQGFGNISHGIESGISNFIHSISSLGSGGDTNGSGNTGFGGGNSESSGSDGNNSGSGGSGSNSSGSGGSGSNYSGSSGSGSNHSESGGFESSNSESGGFESSNSESSGSENSGSENSGYVTSDSGNNGSISNGSKGIGSLIFEGSGSEGFQIGGEEEETRTNHRSAKHPQEKKGAAKSHKELKEH